MTQPSASTSVPLMYRIGFRTDVGQQRSLNEDSGEVLTIRGTEAAFVVCDGMGGLQAGDRASQEAVRVVRETLTELFAGGLPADIPGAMRIALSRANDAVNALHQGQGGAAASDDPTLKREVGGLSSALMGTTCVAGVVIEDMLYVAHAGDSRAYLWRASRLIRLTDDHSYVAERVKAGDITEAEARVSRFRNVVTRAIGIDATVEPDIRSEALLPGDTLLVCSDGLTTMLEDPEIVPILRQQQRTAPDRLASVLVDAANKKGGSDNITVLILRADGPPGTEAPILDAGVEDIAASYSSKRGSSKTAAILGILLILALAVGVYLYLQLKKTQLIASGKMTPQGVVSSPESIDYTKLVYDPPQVYSTLGARGDLLAFSRNGGLYFVRLQSGTITSIGPNGQPLHIDAGTLEVAPATRDVPTTHIFMATDPQGNVYVSYTRRKVIEKHDPEGKVLQTLSGFDRPEAIAVNEEGDLFVVDYNQIKKLHAHLPSPSPAPKPAVSASIPAAGSGNGGAKAKAATKG